MRSMQNVREAADYMGVDCTPAEIANIAGIGLMLERMASMRPPSERKTRKGNGNTDNVEQTRSRPRA